MTGHRKPKPARNEEKAGFQGPQQQAAAEESCSKNGHSWSGSSPTYCTRCGANK